MARRTVAGYLANQGARIKRRTRDGHALVETADGRTLRVRNTDFDSGMNKRFAKLVPQRLPPT